MHPYGINLTGYIRGELGVGESCRSLAAGICATGIPFSVIDYQHGASARMADSTWQEKMQGIQYAANVTVLNAPQLPQAISVLGKDYWDSRYQIAHYAWELPEYPPQWAKLSEMFDEIWTPSDFCSKAVAAAVDCPVYTIPYVIRPALTQERPRSFFALPEHKFLFLTMFDVNSVIERKNPKAAIAAFCKAFGDTPGDVGLVIKINDAENTFDAKEYFRDLIKGKNIYIIDKVLPRNDVNALIKCCDCFVSMHRSEGFGLVMAEAMYFERPVIATNWSGNTDFMTGENSCPVACRLIEVDRDYSVYKKGQLWADPNINDCARYMKRLVTDRDYYETIAKAGKETILKKYSPDAAAAVIRAHIETALQEDLPAQQ